MAKWTVNQEAEKFMRELRQQELEQEESFKQNKTQKFECLRQGKTTEKE